MPLQKTLLSQQFLRIMKDPKGQRSVRQAKQSWTDAYDSYASAATDVSGDLVASKNPSAFRSALNWNNRTGTAAQAALEWEQAFIAYWTGGVFSTGVPPSPAAACPSVPPTPIWQTEITSTVVSATPGLASLLTPILSDNTDHDLNRRAQRMADAFHTATTTNVIVLISGVTIPIPPAPVGVPVTNTCTVF